MIKRVALATLCFCLILAGMWFIGINELVLGPPEKNQPTVAKSSTQADKNDLQMEQVQAALHLALQDISLSQGEGGVELWRLKASWANIRSEDGVIVAEKPTLKYFFPDESLLTVIADEGIIDQQKQILQFIGNAVVQYKQTEIFGDLLIYDGASQSMTIPQKSRIVGAALSGSSQGPLVWHMDTRIIEASDDVSVNIIRTLKTEQNN